MTLFGGEKQLLMFTGRWGNFGERANETSEGNDQVFSIRDIQSTSLFHSISINVINLGGSEYYGRRVINASSAGGGVNRSLGGQMDRTQEFAAMTGGSHFQPSNSIINAALDATIDRLERYYRLRYYSSIDDAKFRRVKVKVKGLNRIGSVHSGYYPKGILEVQPAVQQEMDLDANRSMNLQLQTDWLVWSGYGWKKDIAYYGIGFRVYGEDGSLLAENAFPGSLIKEGEAHPHLSQNILLNIAPDQRIGRVETTITDLSNAKRVFIQTLNSAL
jgi:hypothetical protein